MRILQIVFLLSVCGCRQALRLAISDILEVENITINVMKEFKLLDENVALSPKAKEERLFEKFKVFNKKIAMLYTQFEGIRSQIMYGIVLLTDLQFQVKVKLWKVINNIDLIKIKYQYMVTFLNMTDNLVLATNALEAFARDIVSHSQMSLQTVLDIIHAIIVPSEDGVQSGFKIIHEHMKKPGNKLFCTMHTSEQQLVFYLYNTLALTEVKGFLIMEFSYMFLKLHNLGNFTKEIEATLERYKGRSATTLNLAIEAVKVAGRDLWKCDPDKHVKNETYIEITELLQGCIENDNDLTNSPTHDLKITTLTTCQHGCEYWTFTKSNDCEDYFYTAALMEPGRFCLRNRQCKGNIINCTSIAYDKVCLADASTNRRYEFLTPPHNRSDRWEDCANNTFSIKGWKVFKRKDVPLCEYCMCLCDEQGINSDRYFSLLRSESKIDDNMVVTGLRFVKKNRIIHLQIQEGKILPMAKINVSSVRWRPVKNYRLDDPGVVDGQDYHTLTWDKRGINLDYVIEEEDKVLTGVGFLVIDSRLSLRIRLTPFDFRTGRLEGENSMWGQHVSDDRKKLNLDNKDIPIADKDFPSLPLSEPDMYLEFTNSDLDLDAAQSTVPFLDAQAVVSVLPVPLSGAGFMYKGSKNFGGFITPKIRTYDYTNVLIE